MTGPSNDVARYLAEEWQEVTGSGVAAEDFWLCCQTLTERGLLIGQQRDLAAVAIGPFRIAISKYSAPVRDFVEALVPSMAASLPAGTAAATAVSGISAAAATCLVELLDRGVVFGRSAEDRLRWSILMYVKASGDAGRPPSRSDVLVHFRRLRVEHDGSEEVEAALLWLLGEHAKSLLGSPQQALLSEREGLLHSEV
ncbi:hypothetical protein ACFYTQ_30900 [Nocardia sp. NPDC004068]|uniref:hypothetical protein n=1 Tax=Nocardia sp. NPDC004068 TaxID=3364303 RepID=UPI0036A54899